MPADLHIHSTFSDGSQTPEEIVELLKLRGITAAAVTDHDSVSGIERFLASCSGEGIYGIPGIELSSVHDGEDYHVLGYGINYTDPLLEDKLKEFRSLRLNRLKKMIECLREKGFQIDFEELERDFSGEYSIGRIHLARFMVKKGMAESIDEVFSRWLGRGSECFAEKYLVSPEKQIGLILDLGGLPVLAHPASHRKKPDFEKLKKAGLKGIEVFHPDHSEEDIQALIALADDLNLIVTGGSDAHGEGSERGYTIGKAVLPDSYLKRFLDALI
jgi:predicted metal-dependent phosphoesterase TrpH